MWLCHCTTVDLFVSFHVCDLDDIAVSIKQRNHIKYLFVNMLHQIRNLKYSSYFRITNYIDLEPFIFTITLDIKSPFNVFSTLISLFRCIVSLF